MDDLAHLANEWWLLAILGLVSLAAGVVAIVYPGETLLVIGLIFGIYLLMAGIFELVNAAVGAPESRVLSAMIGVVALIAGLLSTRRPGESLLALVVVLGIYLVVTGAAQLVAALGDEEHRAWAILAALADLVLGVLILAWPGLSLATLTPLFGISLIFRGAIALVGAFQLRKLGKERGTDVAPPMGAATA